MHLADLHTHLMVAVDDGAPDIDASLGWLTEAAAAGMTDVAVTPHVHGFFDLDIVDGEDREVLLSSGWGTGGADPRTFIPEGFASLQTAVTAAGIDITLHRGGELNPKVAMLQDAERLEMIALGPAGHRWILMEVDLFSDFGPGWSAAAEHVRGYGYDIVIAHPERAPNMHTPAARRRLAGEVARGVRLQVNASSLIGFDAARTPGGLKTQQLGLQMIADGIVSAISSDAHPPRRPDGIPALLDVASQLGLDAATVMPLVSDNPLGLLRDGF